MMKFWMKTETLMLQINGNLTASVEQFIINNKVGLAKKWKQKEAVCTFKCLHYLQHQLRHLEALYFLRSL